MISLNPCTTKYQIKHPAGFWRRLEASFLDSLIFWVFISAIILPLSTVLDINVKAIFVTLAGLRQHPDYDEAFLILNMIAILPVLYLWSKFQATPGKMLTSLRIVDNATDGVPTKKQIFIRSLGYFVSAVPLCAGFLWVAIDRNKRGWHDYIAGTKVVLIEAKN
ncbi:MAG: RDD family protein [Thiotrichales bacterium]|nr:RDD family protein [Thiotrichales bacterium]